MLIRRGRYMAGAAAAVLGVGEAGAALMLHDAAGKTHGRADVRYCGLVTLRPRCTLAAMQVATRAAP